MVEAVIELCVRNPCGVGPLVYETLRFDTQGRLGCRGFEHHNVALVDTLVAPGVR